MKKFTLVLLAGGSGSRMKNSLPKQFLLLKEKMVIQYSLELFLTLPEIAEIIVVVDPLHRHNLQNYNVKFAMPGARRQDSLYNALEHISHPWVLTHDAARPLITREMVSRLIQEGTPVGAATLAMPLKPTVKVADMERLVSKTLDRSTLWEIQTPQLLSKKLLQEGFAYVEQHQLTVTDDTSLAELLNHPVKLVEGSYSNLKITTPEDLHLASALLP